MDKKTKYLTILAARKLLKTKAGRAVLRNLGFSTKTLTTWSRDATSLGPDSIVFLSGRIL